MIFDVGPTATTAPLAPTGAWAMVFNHGPAAVLAALGRDLATAPQLARGVHLKLSAEGAVEITARTAAAGGAARLEVTMHQATGGGPPGPQGPPGPAGAAATIAVGNTVTLAPGTSATVTQRGTPAAAIFDFGIPQGQPGTPAEDPPAPVE